VGLDVGALGAYVHDVRRAARRPREVLAPGGGVPVDVHRVRWRRLAVTHATTRLPPGGHVNAAFGGLQDSAPRAALLALHARVEDIGPADWEHPSLAQVWLRWADYVVPRDDVDVFTVGTMPRDPRSSAAIEALADLVVAAIGDGRRDSRSVVDALPPLPHPALIRAAAASGRVHIRWDARTTEIIAADRPSIDVEEARRELARRFLHWLGPASSAHLAKWAGTTRLDAATAWESLASELEPVQFGPSRRWMLADDIDDLAHVERPLGVRLLPAGDPCLYMGDDLPSAPEPRRPDPAGGVTSRLLNSLTGRILVDGTIVGAWGRVQTTVTIDPWPSLPEERAEDVTAEASSLRGPMGAPITVRWLPRRRAHTTRS
jgi:hypothetical protein